MASQPSFFPPREQRELMQSVMDSYPYPIAAAYARLHEELDKQQPVAAAWQLRDCWEVTIRFCSTMALADAFAHPMTDELVPELAKRLLKWNGLSIADWHNLTMESISPLKPLIKSNTLASSGRAIPELVNIFYATHIKLSKVSTAIQGRGDSFVGWRNRVFGHGVFKNDEQWYADQTLEKLTGLHLFLEALQPIFEKWSLVGEDADGQIANWQGVGEVRPSVRHQHEMEGEPLPLRLESEGVSLSLLPFLTIQKCTVCGQHSGFFFDRLKDKSKTMLLEYDDGHEAKRTHWQPIANIVEKLPPNYTFERSAYDKDEIAKIDAIVFRDIEEEYFRPDYILDSIWEHIVENESGYLSIVGPEGMGKTYLMHGLTEDADEYDAVVIPYFIRPGSSAIAQTFGNELHLRASDLQMRTIGPQFRGTSHEEVRQDFTDYLTTVAEENNHIGKIVIAIDALDELAPVEATEISIIDMLPNPDDLPENVFVVITRREQLRTEIRAMLPRIEHGAWQAQLDPASADNTDVVGSFVRTQLDELSQSSDDLVPLQEQPAWVQAIVDQSGGVMLYASHLVRALEGGVFTDVSTLPSGDEFYGAYLDRIRDRVGEQLYRTVYRKALLYLSAAFTSVTFEQLVGWGIPRERLTLAMHDLRDFIRYTRVPGFHDSMAEQPEPRYALAHESFRRYLNSNVPLDLQAAHRHIAMDAVNRFGNDWSAVDPADDRDVYALLYLRDHLGASEDDSADSPDLVKGSLASSLFTLADTALEAKRYRLAAKGFAEVIDVQKGLIEAGKNELLSDLAQALTNRSKALSELGDLPGAITELDEAIDIWRAFPADGQTDVQNNLAATLLHCSNTSRQMGDLPGAIAASSEAIEIWQAGADDGAEVQSQLASALMNRANAQYQNGQLRDAIAGFDNAVDILRTLAGNDDINLQHNLALALMNRSNAHGDSGDIPASISGFDEAIRIVRSLIERGRTELQNDLAMSLMNRANMQARVADFGNATAGYDESIAFWRTLAAAGRTELLGNLALVLMNRAQALQDSGDLHGALEGCDESITIRRKLIEDGRADLLNDLAMVLMNRANVQLGLGDVQGAIESIDESISITRKLVENGRTDLRPNLARALMNRSNALAHQGDLMTALPGFDESVTVMRDLVENGRPELRSDLATTVLLRAKSIADQGETGDAIPGYDEAIKILQALVAEGQVQLSATLATGMLYRADALAQLEELREAIGGYDEAIDIWTNQDLLNPASVPYLATAIIAKAKAHQQLEATADAIASLDSGLDALRSLPEHYTIKMIWLAKLTDCKAVIVESSGDTPAAIDLRLEVGRILKNAPPGASESEELRTRNSDVLARLKSQEEENHHG